MHKSERESHSVVPNSLLAYGLVFICIALIFSIAEYLITHLLVIIGKPSIQILWPFFNLIVCFSVLSCMCSLYIFSIKFLLGTVGTVGTFTVRYSRLPFCFVDDFHCSEEALYFDVIPHV